MKSKQFCFVICMSFCVIHCARLTTKTRASTTPSPIAMVEEPKARTVLSSAITIKPNSNRSRLPASNLALKHASDTNIKDLELSVQSDSSLNFGKKILNNYKNEGTTNSTNNGNKRNTNVLHTATSTVSSKKKVQHSKKYIPVEANRMANINESIKRSGSTIQDIKTNNNLNGPTKFVLPNPFIKTTSTQNPISKQRKSRGVLICPKESQAHYNLFAPNCRIDKDCLTWDKESRCCNIFGGQTCTKGVPKPVQEETHTPIFGFIQRKCPTNPLAELWWEIQTCETDNDCWPRICCPDGKKKYCRTSKPTLDAMPTTISNSISYLTEYLECTSPPPQIFDLHPKPCGSTFDCFPNVCCQESGKKHCRPPKKSILTLMANFFNLGLVKRLATNLSIK